MTAVRLTWEPRIAVDIRPALGAGYAIIPNAAVISLSSLHGTLDAERSVGMIARELGARVARLTWSERAISIRVDGDIAAVWSAIQTALGRPTALPESFGFVLREPGPEARADADRAVHGWKPATERERDADDWADRVKHGDQR